MKDQTPVEELSGRELDVAVAEEVFGYEVRAEVNVYDETKVRIIVGEDGAEWHVPISAYSTDIKFAWEVVEKLQRDAQVDVMVGPTGESVDPRCEIHYHGYRPFQDRSVSARAATVPEAICRASLKLKRAGREARLESALEKVAHVACKLHHDGELSRDGFREIVDHTEQREE